MNILETERLRLRWFDEGDAAFILELSSDPDVKRFISDWGLRDEAEAWRWIEGRLVAGYWRSGLGSWAMERKGDGQVVGLCGLVKRQGLPQPDVGYALLPRHRGHGYAREAAAACLEYGAFALGLPEIMAITAPDNDASARLLDALGMERLEQRALEGEERVSVIYRWPSPVGEAAQASEDAQIKALTDRFLGLFDNRGGAIPRLPTLPWFTLPNATFAHGRDAQQAMDLRGFMEPRAALLSDGRLTEFHEREITGETRRFGRVAQRWLRYHKAGILEGEPFETTGWKGIQLAKGQGGWRIASVLWEDDPGVA